MAIVVDPPSLVVSFSKENTLQAQMATRLTGVIDEDGSEGHWV